MAVLKSLRTAVEARRPRAYLEYDLGGQIGKTMRVTVNGEVREAPDRAILADYLASLGIDSGRIAVERNLEIAPKSLWGSIRLAEGDRLEIVQFVGGG